MIEFIGYDPQRPFEYYNDKDYYPFPLSCCDMDVKTQYVELGGGGDVDNCWFIQIGCSGEESLETFASMLTMILKIEHYMTDYERTTLCIRCAEDVEASYPDVIVWRYWEFCPRCGTRLVHGYVKVR